MLCTSAGHTLNAHIGTAVPKLLALANQPEAGPKEVSPCRGGHRLGWVGFPAIGSDHAAAGEGEGCLNPLP